MTDIGVNNQSTRSKTRLIRCISKQVSKAKVILGPKWSNNIDPITLLLLRADLLIPFNNAAVHEVPAV